MDQEFINGNPDSREAQTFEQNPAAIEVIKEQQHQITALMNEISMLKVELSKSKEKSCCLREKIEHLTEHYEEKLSKKQRMCDEYSRLRDNLDNAVMESCMLNTQLKVERMRNSDIIDSPNREVIDSLNSMLEHTRHMLTDLQTVQRSVSYGQNEIKTVKSHAQAAYGGE